MKGESKLQKNDRYHSTPHDERECRNWSEVCKLSDQTVVALPGATGTASNSSHSPDNDLVGDSLRGCAHLQGEGRRRPERISEGERKAILDEIVGILRILQVEVEDE